ncbi:hypothetical protein LX36DRAFT_652118, partial [Colletotrichum falcatum]
MHPALAPLLHFLFIHSVVRLLPQALVVYCLRSSDKQAVGPSSKLPGKIAPHTPSSSRPPNARVLVLGLADLSCPDGLGGLACCLSAFGTLPV